MSQELKFKFQALFDPDRFSYKNSYTRAVASQIHTCHTAARGYHCYQCNNEACGYTHLQYHSCGNRHCCFCGTLKKDQWVEERVDDLLPCPYYHIVFTVPHEWNKVMMQAPKELYKILFDAASQTLLTLGRNGKYLGGTPGITAVLHTWGQSLDYHVHLHCIVSGGGIKCGQWMPPKRSKGKFLFPVAVLKKVYKGTFLHLVRERKEEIPVADKQLDEAMEKSGKKPWKVYAKIPFGGPEQVINYLGRYTHKTAITHHRIREIEQGWVSFEYKDYRDNKHKVIRLREHEFMRRFEQHILPYRFVRIRHFGFLANRGKAERISALRQSLGLEENPPKIIVPIAIRMLEKYGRDITRCQACKRGRYQLLLTKRYGKVVYFRPRDGPQV